ncbi:hypothetical protein CLOM_g16046 [Closterium sp. NIES-68]|nr:hypothetical protein CLOM_g16046 [Closterium sp. NIES-68]GJP72037.1 hypothetical protein CLOP_g2809 [Closterium sp. NIES-67]GJP79995.1 hypothetical protein CLOP_g10219 [Closterium sp. NIES-67]
MASASQPISCPPASAAGRMVRVSSTEKMDFVPHLRDVSQFSSTPTNTRLAGTPPARNESLADGKGVATQAIFKFGRPTLPDVVEAGDPVLHEPARPVPAEDIGSPEIEKIINDMVAVMRAAPGVGLAANQIGHPLQIIVLEDTVELMRVCDQEDVKQQERKPFNLLVIINPVLKPVGDSKARFFEGCLSVNGYRGMVERHLEVEVTGLGRDGKPLTVHATGWQARILQHECDHLAGLLYVDRVVPRTFRTGANLRLPLPKGCPKPGCC